MDSKKDSEQEEKKAPENSEENSSTKYSTLNESSQKVVIESTDLDIKKINLDYLVSNAEWDSLELSEPLRTKLINMGFKAPSNIQNKAITAINKMKQSPLNLLIQAQNGSGKTLSFLVPILNSIEKDKSFGSENNCTPQAIILTPTRELAKQIYDVAIQICVSLPWLQVGACFKDCDRTMSGHLIIGTPGFISSKFHARKGFRLSNEYFKIMALDECDELLNQETIRDPIDKIYEKLQKGSHAYFISATIESSKVKEFIKGAGLISLKISKESLTLEGVHQLYAKMTNDEKFDYIASLFKVVDAFQTIIFVNSKNYGRKMADHLQNLGFSVGFMSGDIEETKKNLIMAKFKSGSIKILITTNLLSRGIDLRQVLFVINADLPRSNVDNEIPEYETYLHRIGRTGRYGDVGVALNLIDGRISEGLMEKIKEYYKGSNLKELKNVKDLAGILEKCKEITNEKKDDLEENK